MICPNGLRTWEEIQEAIRLIPGPVVPLIPAHLSPYPSLQAQQDAGAAAAWFPALTVSQLGDLWHLDRHRLVCGDASSREAYEVLLGPDLAQMIVTDPPCRTVCKIGTWPVRPHLDGGFPAAANFASRAAFRAAACAGLT